MLFMKGGILRRHTQFRFGDYNLEMVNKCTYLDTIFTTGGAFHEAQQAMSGRTLILRLLFTLNVYVRKFVTCVRFI